MTGNRDRFGEVIEPPEPDDTLKDDLSLARSRDQIHHDRCAQLRRILREARERREAQQ